MPPVENSWSVPVGISVTRMVYSTIIPFLCSTGGGCQFITNVVGSCGVAVTPWGGAVGAVSRKEGRVINLCHGTKPLLDLHMRTYELLGSLLLFQQ